ncbi:MAG: adenylate/guanylate cyclase domain-containing protein [Candidatus Binataceae bacterium]
MLCSKCKTENPPGKKFCGDCGAALANLCPKCRADNPAGKRFCGECGTALGEPAAAAAKKSDTPPVRVSEAPDPEKLDGERKTVTALFADIKGSTELEQDLDPEEARAIVDPALKLMIDAAHRYDGYVVQSTGDGIFALFGAPVAHEDHPQRALLAALRMQQEIKKLAGHLRAEGRAPIQIRVGLNTGEVVVRPIQTGERHVEYTPIGHTANLASRMQTLAEPGSVVVSETTFRLCDGYFLFRALGPSRVKGVSEPVNVYELTGLGSLRTRLQRSAGRGLSKFVGREREMTAMRHALELVKKGHGQVVAAMGEAGLGKSRLLYEFKMTSQSGCLTLETFSVSHGKASAYLPVIELLNNYFEIEADDDARKRRERMAGKVVMLDRALEDSLPYLFALLGVEETAGALAQMDGQVRQRRTLEAIKRILQRESLNQPLIVVFEDLHWVDNETQALLDLLVDAIANAHVLLLVNYRPQYRHNWSNKGHYAQLRLDPLGRESAEEMLTALLGDDAALQPLRRLITDKTEGNPFYMEETVQVLLDEGALVRNGALKLTKPFDELKIPPTVQAILASRIDRLPADEKDLLQTLAVMGKEFPLGLVRKVAGESDDELERMLGDLQLGEFIYEQPALPDVEYTFKHALTHEVAYGSVLNERRKPLHERTARALEWLFADQLDDHLPDLAHHYSRSGNTNKAIHYLRMVGEQAARRCAHEEAIGRFNSALEMLARLPDGQERTRWEVELRLALIGSLVANKGYAAPEVAESVRRALALSSELDEPEFHFSALMFAWAFHLVSRELERAGETSRELIEIAERAREPAMIVHANFASGAVSVFCGKLQAARARLEQAVAIHDPPPMAGMPQDPRVAALSFLSLTLWLLGYPAAAVGMTREAVRRARGLGHPMSMAFALSYGAMLHLCHRDPEAARELAEEARRVATEHGFRYWSALGSTYSGIVQAALGLTEGGIAETLAGIDAYRATGSALGAAAVVVGLVSSYLKAGLAGEALRVAEQQLTAIEQTGARMSEAELYRLKGEALLSSGASPEKQAQACFEKAIMVARAQEARSWELRATMSLGRLLDKQGRRNEARQMLADIYNWFTEGLDTADLKDAKALLDGLSA